MASTPTAFDGYSFKVANFKCFGDEPQGFDELKTVNVIIGRNNSGKSALLDLIRFCVENNFDVPRELWRSASEPIFEFSSQVSEELARRVFREGSNDSNIPGETWNFGRRLVGSRARWRRHKRNVEFADIGPEKFAEHFSRLGKHAGDFGCRLGQAAGNPLQGRIFRRLAAERDIRPEKDRDDLKVGIEGDGATNITQNYLNQASRDRRLVEVDLLAALNEVFAPDALFTRILCHQLGNNGAWEIYLEEEHKGLIPLSQSGSGLKTVMLVLINFILVPASTSTQLSNYVFGFEELENNLHPSLLRRLLVYVAHRARETGFLAFLTTHSSAAIDLFSKQADAQIIHVRHDGKTATATTTRTYIENAGILDDLDVRASDLLQANCVIWVEGPSDRIYINRWVSLWSNGILQEGVHYLCVFYGGRLLSHLEGCSPDEAASGIPILRLARHACVVMDSDKRAQQTPINDTKRRIQSELESVGGLVWITKGREVENYIPRSAFRKWKGWDEVPDGVPYEDVFEFLDSKEQGLGKRYRNKKPAMAEALVPLLNLESCRTILDLDDRMTELCKAIQEWNRLRD